MADGFVYFLAWIGLYALSCYLYDNLRTPAILIFANLREVFQRDRKDAIKAKYGDWAAITGASDGIGRAYAKELARKGMNVVLISRTESKLKAVAAEIEENYSVQTKIIVADFTQTKDTYEHIEKELEKVPVRILINNVGQSTSMPGLMWAFDAQELWNVINVNIAAATQLSRYFIKRLRKAGERGLVLNVSSGTEMQGLPYGAIYAASKAYLRSLSISLQIEARPFGIDVHYISPWFVTTNLNTYSDFIMRGNFLIPNADTYARSAVNCLGKVDQTSGYRWHGLQTAVMKALPWRCTMAVISMVTKKVCPKEQLKLD